MSPNDKNSFSCQLFENQSRKPQVMGLPYQTFKGTEGLASPLTHVLLSNEMVACSCIHTGKCTFPQVRGQILTYITSQQIT